MTSREREMLSGEIFADSVVLSVSDLCRMFAIEERRVFEWVEEGVLTTIEINSTEWRFDGTAARRARIAQRLERDLGVNLPGIALALDLLDELEQLRRLTKVQPR